MGATYRVFRREFASYFNTPIGYVFMAAFLIVPQFIFTSQMMVQQSADMRGFFGMLPLLFTFFIPAISMRMWSEERKLGTLEWLLTLPMNAWHAVLGKYLAGLAFIAVFLGLSALIPIFMAIYGNPDWGPVIGGYLGSMVLAMIYLAIGSFASSLTSDQIIAFVVGVAINLVFLLLGMLQDWIKDVAGDSVASAVNRFAIDTHFESISRGVVDTRDIIYAVSIAGAFLFLNVLVIDRRR